MAGPAVDYGTPMDLAPPYLAGARLIAERVPEPAVFPFTLPIVRDLDLHFDRAVTIFLGENGCGKTTVLQALAVLARLPAGGGGRSELGYQPSVALDLSAALARAMRPSFRRHPAQAWYFRADMLSSFASSLVERDGKHAYREDPEAIFRDRPLHELSHGESFLATLHNRAHEGLLFLDEPESALSPQRQLTLLALLARMVSQGQTQVVMATHSPLMMTFPGARLLSFDGGEVAPIRLEDTQHYSITRGMLECPERYWKHLLER